MAVNKYAKISRGLLVFDAFFLVFSALTHYAGYQKVFSDPAVSKLTLFTTNGFRLVWLADSAVQIITGVIFGFIAYKHLPQFKWIVLLLAMIPLANAVLAYYFLGNFIGGHLLAFATIIAIAAGLLYPTENDDAENLPG